MRKCCTHAEERRTQVAFYPPPSHTAALRESRTLLGEGVTFGEESLIGCSLLQTLSKILPKVSAHLSSQTERNKQDRKRPRQKRIWNGAEENEFGQDRVNFPILFQITG